MSHERKVTMGQRKRKGDRWVVNPNSKAGRADLKEAERERRKAEKRERLKK